MECRSLRNHILTYRRIFVGRYLIGEHIGDTPHRQFHIRLPGAEEYIAAEHVGKSDVIDVYHIRASGLESRKFQFPTSETVGHRLDLLGLFHIHFCRDAFARLGRAPQAHRLSALHHHAVAKYRRQFHARIHSL